MTHQDESVPTDATIKAEMEQIERRLDMLDHRLDNIDSVVSAIVERVMKQPVTLNITCSKCGHSMEITLVGTEKPSSKYRNK